MTGWPAVPAETVFHGPAGEFVLRTEPHSEAHPMALLAQFLVAFGTACGRGAHYTIEADDHYPNKFCVLVGPSGKGRKGSSWGHVPRARRGRPRLRKRLRGERSEFRRGADRSGPRRHR